MAQTDFPNVINFLKLLKFLNFPNKKAKGLTKCNLVSPHNEVTPKVFCPNFWGHFTYR